MNVVSKTPSSVSLILSHNGLVGNTLFTAHRSNAVHSRFSNESTNDMLIDWDDELMTP